MPPLPPPRQSRGTAAGHGSFLTSGTLASRLLGGVLVVLLVSLGLAVAPAPARADGAGCDDAMLTSADQVTLGVSCLGNLGTQPTVADPEGVGLRFLPTEAEAVTQGGVYEGWGVADGDSGVTGNVDPGFAPQNGGQASTNLTLLSFAADAVHAVSHVRVGNTFELTQDVHPSDANPNLFEATVTITNISSATTDLRYRRVMDWDIPPTRFQELVTLQKGSSPYLVYTSDDGFASADPQSERSQRLASGSFVNSGPRDHGALFDFDFGALPAGDSHSFKIFYGAAQNEATAKTALQVAGAEAYSLGEANGSQLDPPVSPADLNTFMFGFKNIAGDANAVFTPFAVKDSASIVTGQQAQINVLANDSDPRGHAISVTGSTAPSHGTATCDTTTCTYVPAADWTGTDTFTYTISNADHLTATADVKVTVSLAAQNHPPVALDDVLTTGEDTDGTVQVLANDSDVDGGEGLAVVVKTQPAHGAVTCQPSGECTYVPSSNYYGDDSFGYTLSDGAGGADDATVVVHVTPVDDDPVGQAISASTDEDTATSITLLATDVDDAPANLSFAAPSESVHGGTITCTTAGACTYQPKPNYAGDDSFTYTISDGHGGSGTQTVSITVNPVNDDPVARDKSFTVAEDSHGEDTVDLLAGATDVDGDTVGLVSHTAAAHGSLDCVVAVCTYVPAQNYNGPDSFSYTVTDNHGGSDTGTVSITVTPVNDAPVAVADSLTVDEDTAGSVDVLTNDTDADGDPLNVQDVTQPDHGLVSCTPAGHCTYTPEANFHGADTFTYRASDGTATSPAVSVAVTVTSVNDAPVAQPITVSAVEDIAKLFALSAADVDGDNLAYSVATNPAHGTASCSGAGACTYTPSADYNGPDSFTYTVSDGHGGTDTKTVTITVTSVNDLPVAQALSATTAEDTAKAITLSATDVDGDTLTYTAAAPSHGTVSCTVAACTYTPSLNYNGPDSFTYTVTDGHGGSDTRTVSLTVTPVNDAPVAVADSTHTNPGRPVSIDVLANDSDVDGDVLTVSVTQAPTSGSVNCSPSGHCTFTPAGIGVDTFGYTVSDGHGLTATATVTVTTALNREPALGAPTLTTPAGVAGTVHLLDGATDPDGDQLTIDAFTQPVHGAVLCVGATCSYTPAAGYHGADSFTYTVSDGHGGVAVGTVQVTVVQLLTVPDAPRLAKTKLGTAAVTKALTTALAKTYKTKPGTKAAKAKALAKAKAKLVKKKYNLLAGWVPPAYDGGSKITGYKVVLLTYAAPKSKTKASPKSKVTPKVASKKTLSVKGQDLTLPMKLKPGTYAIQVMAVNAQGTSVPSGLSKTLVIKK